MAFTERYVSVAGGGSHDGTSEANAWTLAEAITAAPGSGTRINVKAGTYANTTTSRSLSLTGTTTAPIWWRGYNTTIGDRDTNPALTPPLISFTTGTLTAGGAHQVFSHLDIYADANTSRTCNVTGANLLFDRCRIENANAGSASYAVANSSSATNLFTRCDLKVTSTADRVVSIGIGSQFYACVIRGGVSGLHSTSAAVEAIACVIHGQSSHGIHLITTGSIVRALNCTFYGQGGDGIRLDVLPSTFCEIYNTAFSTITGTAINNNSGANTNVVKRMGNGFHACGANEAGFGDSPALDSVSESNAPFTNAGSLDFSIVPGSTFKAAGQPGLFEAQTYRSYLDLGAVQRQESGGGGRLVGPSALVG